MVFRYHNKTRARRKHLYLASISQLLFKWAEKKYAEAINAGTASKKPKKGSTVMPLTKKATAVIRKNNPTPAFDIRSTMHIFFFMRHLIKSILLQNPRILDSKATFLF
jgi:hypothetical protein